MCGVLQEFIVFWARVEEMAPTQILSLMGKFSNQLGRTKPIDDQLGSEIIKDLHDDTTTTSNTQQRTPHRRTTESHSPRGPRGSKSRSRSGQGSHVVVATASIDLQQEEESPTFSQVHDDTSTQQRQ